MYIPFFTSIKLLLLQYTFNKQKTNNNENNTKQGLHRQTIIRI